MTLRVTCVSGNLLTIWFLIHVVWASAKALPRQSAAPAADCKHSNSQRLGSALQIANFGLRIRKQQIAPINPQFEIRNTTVLLFRFRLFVELENPLDHIQIGFLLQWILVRVP